MHELELFTDQQLEQRIDDCNYLLDYGCTMDAAIGINYELQACQEILRRRIHERSIGPIPEWFEYLINY